LGLNSTIVPSRSASCQMSAVAVAVSKGGGASSLGTWMGGGIGELLGQVATARREEPIRIQTSTRVAPVPLATSATMRSSCSSSGPVRAIASANRDMTSYGVARSPYTSRLAASCARRRNGWNSMAITTAAPIVRIGPPPEPTRAPIPATIAT
jgi:hypothetical protein